MYVPRANGKGEAEPGSERPAASETAACCSRCSANQEREARAQQAKRPLEFSAEMLKDQELLVSTLSQQGISEALIRRQFNKLLEEQSKQLARQQREAAEEPSRERQRSLAASASASTAVRDVGEPRRASATSLPKQRLKREQQDLRSRNNGLQDLVTAARIIEKARSSQSEQSKCALGTRVRLNGAQDGAAPESEAFCRAHSLRQASDSPVGACAARRSLSSNGLENCRRPAAGGSTGEPAGHSSGGGDHPACCSAAAGGDALAGDKHVVVNSDEQAVDRSTSSLHRCPDPIQEPRVFGGFTYFARKPQSIPQLARNAQQYPQASQASDQLQHTQPSAMHPAKSQRNSVCAS